MAGIPETVVVQIFAKRETSHEDWTDIQAAILKAINASSTGLGTFLNNDRILQILATTPSSKTFGELTLAKCHELHTSTPVQEVEQNYDVEVVVQPMDVFEAHQEPGLAVFDMDSTLIQQEVIDELARSVGRYDQVAAVTEAAMRGELDFEESLRARVAKLKGVSTDIWEKLKADVISFTPGAYELVQVLKSRGWKTAVLSGGFTPLAFWVKDTLGLDYAYANQLTVDDSTATLSGEVLPNTPIVGAALKRELLLKLAADNDVPISRTIAVGDGSNDLLMMNAAGFGVAFNAKPKVQLAAPARLNGSTLLDIAYVLGFEQNEVDKVVKLHTPNRQ
jgi:phosphoserine phosphatase